MALWTTGSTNEKKNLDFQQRTCIILRLLQGRGGKAALRFLGELNEGNYERDKFERKCFQQVTEGHIQPDFTFPVAIRQR